MHRGIRAKIIILTLACLIASGVALTGISAWRSQTFASSAAQDVSALVEEDLDRAARGIYDVVAAQGESISDRVTANMRVAATTLSRAGGLRFGAERVTWSATNQVNQQVSTITLPQALVGSSWLGQQKSVQAAVPVVDDVYRQVGGAVTVFQRMNAAGDMLRVATNVTGKDGQRAIGTYIPARNADGSANAVVAAAEAGKPYVGVAQVVGQWYVTRYEPIRRDGQLIGMLFVGFQQESVAALRSAIEKTKVGTHGVVDVLGTKGTTRGVVRISGTPGKAGTTIVEATDAAGKKYVADSLDAAVKAGPNAVVRVAYQHPEAGPSTIRAMYYPEWDWVIALLTRDADFAGPLDNLQAGRAGMLTWLIASALAITLAGAAVAAAVGASLTAPLLRLRDRMAEIADGEGDLTQRVEADSQDEVGQLGSAFNRFIDKVATAVRGVSASAGSLSAAAQGMRTVSTDLHDTAARSSAQAGQARDAAGAISESVHTAAAGTEQMTASIRQIAQSAAEAARVGQRAGQLAAETEATVTALGDSSTEISNVIKVISAVAEQTNLLALNATIEAARAGEAGKGFAVVASEVKDLAQQTGAATEEISRRIQAIQADSRAAVESITQITHVVREITDHQAAIAAAVDEQSATTTELSQGITAAADAVGNVNHAIAAVSRDAGHTADEVGRVREAAEQLNSISGELSTQLGVFVV
ncbi:MAG: methyl-accepting chemotaxis protein [Austwickia sp.]|nr:methyl-accepting chemotaxis protein [Austwickia sp.]MBK8436301.1 methyl-accepting chemotaxis protein [Austwickia sp.]MBK9101979.1 methyl-accepting chemotaxis protein [Austwickia sp.]